LNSRTEFLTRFVQQGLVTSRDVGFAVVATSSHLHSFALSLLYACIFAGPWRRRHKAVAALSVVFAAYVLFPLVPKADAGRHLVATLVLTMTQVAVIAAMAAPALAVRAPGTIRGDRAALERILGNLAANAARACRAGPLEIAVEPGPAGEAARLLVRDDGPGMPPAARARLRGPASATGHAAADGAMGLTVVRTLAQALGAGIGVSTPSAGGTLVTVDLPVGARERVAKPVADGLRLLLVEGDPVKTAATITILRAEGHTVATATDAARGVELAAAGGFDAALVDLDLGRDAGCDAIRAIRRLPDPVPASLPVVVVSGRPTPFGSPAWAAPRARFPIASTAPGGDVAWRPGSGQFQCLHPDRPPPGSARSRRRGAGEEVRDDRRAMPRSNGGHGAGSATDAR
jgi:hypothetical protein